MSPWITALLIAVLLATVPLTWIFRILWDLPPPLLLSHSRWPSWVNFALIGAITANVTVFVQGVYYGGTREPLALALQFVIAVVIYFFGFVLIVRQFAGLYPEYFVTTGRTGLSIRKALYRNVVDIDEMNVSGGETRLRLHMQTGESLHLALPTRHLSVLHAAIKDNQPPL